MAVETIGRSGEEKGPGGKECRQPGTADKPRKWILPGSLQKEPAPLTLGYIPMNYKIIN